MAVEPLISYLRLRVVNTSPLFYFTDGFENTGSGNTVNLWNSLGTDATGTLSYWTQVAGSWSIASNLVTAPAAAAALMTGGHGDWKNTTFTVRFKWVTGSSPMIVMHCDGTDANWVGARVNGTTIFLDKVVAGVFTNGITSGAAALVNGTFYWLQVFGVGTSYTAAVYNDSAGALGTLITSVAGTVADAGLQMGIVGLRNGATVSYTYGGAFTTVCKVHGTPPDGTQGQAWSTNVASGEPAFAWSDQHVAAGTYAASIDAGGQNAADGSWQQSIRLFAGSNVTLSAQTRVTGGTGTVTVAAGGLTTPSAPAPPFAAVSVSGAITANPTVTCRHFNNTGRSYFDSISITNPAYEITSDLPHLHQTHIDVVAMQPGNPGSTALGSWTAQLHSPGTEGYAAAKAIYDQLDYVQRVEFYISPDGAGLGKLYYAGIITGIRKGYGQNSTFELTGVNDLFWLNYSKPFPGDLLQNSYGGVTTTLSYRQAHTYFGTNEVGGSDNFNPYTSANYLSTAALSLASGSWSSTTDDGLNVVSCSTGTGAALISKLGAGAKDGLHNQYVEATIRLTTNSASGANAGKVGVGFSTSNQKMSPDAVYGYVIAKANGSQYDLDTWVNASGFDIASALTAFTSTKDQDGFITLTIGLLTNDLTTQLVVNGKSVASMGGLAPSTLNCYPFLFFGSPASGAATGYFTNLVQMIRYADDANPGTAAFKAGSIGTANHSLLANTDPGPTFLEIITRAATREGWYWRYTPQPYVGGVRTLGTIDMKTDPGTDWGSNRQVLYER